MSDAGDGIGTLATGALWARTFGGGKADAQAAHDEGGRCANCGTERIGPYCHACGQMGHVHKNLRALAHDIAHGVFHFEGKVWHTLPLLAWHPGQLTRRYVDGERAKFVSPMALFLFSVFLMFAIVSNLSGHRHPGVTGTTAHGNSITTVGKVDPAVKLKADRARLAALEKARASASTNEAREAIKEQIGELKDEIRALDVATTFIGADKDSGPRVVHLDTGWSWFDDSVRGMSENPALTIYKMKTYGYKYSWALIPISLPFIWLLFAFRRDVGLYDHAIFSIYSLSFMSLGVVALTLFSRLGLPAALVSLAAMLVPPIHMYRQLKGTYSLGRFGAAWRTAALLIITTITSSLFIAFLFWMGSE
ncbi:DUF3667 domain-containing protein [Sphingomonas crusticola]|uniref:DUF3667 domain-containing protein n=1 Tax=Sphingomonas crusticola TaxID=1697973 RepID=UPI001F07FF01|nr:DUF3667 domain-containing protein [Sphingomonas crusticola]